MEYLKINFFVILCLNVKQNLAKDNLISILEEKLEHNLGEYTKYAASALEEFNDERLGRSEIGRIIHYHTLKSKFGNTQNRNASKERGMKKMSMALIPLIFHMGAATTWLMLTGIMTVKSVGIGIILLIFKIAVSSAKVSSFFTSLKAAKHDDQHHDWSYLPPHHDHYAASFNPPDVFSYSAGLHSGRLSPYNTLPTLNNNVHEEHFFEHEVHDVDKIHRG